MSVVAEAGITVLLTFIVAELYKASRSFTKVREETVWVDLSLGLVAVAVVVMWLSLCARFL